MGGRAARARAPTTGCAAPPPNPPATAVQSLRERTTGCVSPRARRPLAPAAAARAARSPRRPPTAAQPADRPPPPPPLQVDLNRNFGFKWGYNNEDSSPYGCAEEYRGKEAFSEPETRGLRDLVHLHRPKAILHWHGWCAAARPTPAARCPLPPARPPLR